ATGDELLKSDLELAQQANMDMFRVNAHVEPPALYEAADQAGLLIWQDMPMVASYVHRADVRSLTFFREAVMSQAEELVHMLFNKPSVICYAVHADPPWSRSLAWLGERHTEQLNRDVDEEAAGLMRTLDPSRPVLAGAGDQDLHCGQGWSQGHWRDLAGLSPAFVSEVGAQALPNANSPVWRNLNRGWPVADDDESWRYAGYQPAEWPRGRLQHLRIVCVNDDPSHHGRARLRWRIERERAYETSAWREIRGWFAKRRFRGHDWITIPDQLDPAAVIAEPAVRLHADGVYRVTAELEVAGQPIAHMEHRFLVGDPPRGQRLSAGRSDRLAQRALEPLVEARR